MARSAIVGIPYSSTKQPDPVGTVQAFEALDARVIANSAGAIIRNSLVALNATTTPASGLLAWVMGDAIVANNGVYENNGTSVSPNWMRRGPLPFGHIYAINVGAGTANAIEVTTWLPIPVEDGAALITVPIVEPNTSTTVTIIPNGGSPLTVKTNSGGVPPIGGLIGTITGIKVGSEFRLLSDPSQYANFDHQGDWSAVVTYTENQIVTGSDGYWYQLKITSSLNDNPVSGGSGDWLQILTSTSEILDNSIEEPKLANSLSLTLTQTVENITALKNVDLTRYQTFVVRDPLTGGTFHRRNGDQSALCVVKSVTTSTANTGTDELTSTAHGLYTTDVVIATSTVAGVTAETLYWVIRTGANTFKLAASHADCLAGTPVVNITATTAITFKHLRDPLQGVYTIPTGAALDGSGGIIERHRGQADERSWWPATNAGLQAASDFANKLLFRAGSENATKIFVKHASTIWEGEGMFASIVNFTHTSGYGIVNVLAGSGSLQNNFIIRAMQVNGASLTSSGGIIRAEDFGYSHFDEVYFFGVQVNQTWALDVRSTWPQGTYYCTVTNCIFGLMQFGVYLGDGGNNNLIAHNRFQQASPGGGQCITLDGSAAGYISSTLLLANITELPGNVTTGIYAGAAVDGLTIIAHRYESMLTGLIVAAGAKNVQNINPYYEGCTTKVNNASRGLIFNQVAAASWYGVTGIIEYAQPYGGTPTRASTGLYRFTFTAALPHANFVAVVDGTAIHTKIVGQSTTYVDIECLNASHARVDADLINLTVYIAQ